MNIEKLANIELRNFPRINNRAPIKISGDLEGSLINVSNSGISFASLNKLQKKRYKLYIHLPSNIIEANTTIVWNSLTNQKGELLYGARIESIDNKSLVSLQKFMVSNQYKLTIMGLHDKRIRKSIFEFSKLFRNYLFELLKLNNQLTAEKDYNNEIQKKLNRLNDNIVMQGDSLKSDINDKLMINKIKSEFRTLIGSWAFKSQIMKRGFDKPKGYPGDFETLETIYDRKTFAKEKNLGYYFDMYFLTNPYAEAVRNRKNFMKNVLTEYFLTRYGKDRRIKILNLASGSCRELVEILDEGILNNAQLPNVFFTCLDWEVEALNYSKQSLKSEFNNIQFNFVHEDLLNFIKSDSFFQKQGKHDLVYSIGLADYLPDRVLKKMINVSFNGLVKDGEFILAHKDKAISFSHLPPEWFCDWVFIPRDEKDMLRLISESGINEYTYSVERDPSKQIFFIRIRKDN